MPPLAKTIEHQVEDLGAVPNQLIADRRRKHMSDEADRGDILQG